MLLPECLVSKLTETATLFKSMASTTARFFLKNGKSFPCLLRNPLLGLPNPQVFQSLTNTTTHKLYLQRPAVFKDGFDFVDFVRGKPSSEFDRMEAARVKKQPVSDEDESGDKYGSDDEVNIADEDIEDLFSGGDDFDEKEDDDDDDGGDRS